MMVRLGSFKIRRIGKAGLAIGIPSVMSKMLKLEPTQALEWFRDTDHPERLILAREGEIVDPTEIFK